MIERKEEKALLPPRRPNNLTLSVVVNLEVPVHHGKY